MNKIDLMDKVSITVAIVDDHTLFREGLVNLLSEYNEISILFESKNGVDMQDKISKHGAPDIVLMDINMPVMDGHQATTWIKQNFPLINILALSMYEDEKNIIKMIKEGAGGYILKECRADELVRAILEIMKSGYYINEIVSGKLIHSIQNDSAQDSSTSIGLSLREIEFLQLCCTELTYKEIADKMKVSPRTVDGYREALFEKLDIKSRTGLVLYAIKHGLITIDGIS